MADMENISMATYFPMDDNDHEKDYVAILTDCNGDTMTQLKHDGELFPFFPDLKRKLSSGEFARTILRPTDIWVLSYPKTGNHWTCQLCLMIPIRTLEQVPVNLAARVFEARDRQELEDSKSPRVLNTHLRPKWLPEQLFDGATEVSGKIVLISRDLRDIIVSFYHHSVGLKQYNYTGRFDGFLGLVMNGKIGCESPTEYFATCYKTLKDRCGPPGSGGKWIIISYEALNLNFVAEARKLAKFLGIEDIDDGYLNKLREALNVNNMLTHELQQKINIGGRGSIWKPNSQGSFIRKGKVGDWKNHFTVGQHEEFMKWFQEESEKYPVLKELTHLLIVND